MTGARAPLYTIAATFTAEPVEATLRYWVERLKTRADVEFAPYDQVFQQLLDPASAFHSERAGLNVILLRLEDWGRTNGDTTRGQSMPGSGAQLERDFDHSAAEFIDTLKSAAARMKRSTLVIVCPSSPEAEVKFSEALRATELRLESTLAEVAGIRFVSRTRLLHWYATEHYHAASDARLGHVPYTPEFYAALGTTITRIHESVCHAPRKVIVLDCDMTLWRGVCGEDGPTGIDFDGPHEALQRFMLARHDEGMLLCLCSKNEESDVFDVFAFNAEMPLQPSHFVAHRINWKSKAENLKSLAKELRLGLDSFIFVDDSSIECAEVEAACPEVLAIRLPNDSKTLPHFLNHVWAFDRREVTEVDRQRTEMYRVESRRSRASLASKSLAEFIDSLQLEIRFTDLTHRQLDRAAQLTFRTNQLNFTTVRRSAADLRELCEARGHECQIINVSDRFGDYGIVGVIIYRTVDTELEVDTFLLSCRVIGRGVEHRMAAFLGEVAQSRGLDRVNLNYRTSRKNAVALGFLHTIAGEFEETRGEGLTFAVPPAVLAGVRYQPSEEKPENSNGPIGPADGRAVADAKTDSAMQMWIASEASRPDEILRAVEDTRRRLRSGAGTKLVAPRTATESRIAQIWAEVLGVEEVGVHDSFFRLGGDSLSMTRVIARIFDAFYVEVSFEAFFEAPTVAALAANAVRSGALDTDTRHAESTKASTSESPAAVTSTTDAERTPAETVPSLGPASTRTNTAGPTHGTAARLAHGARTSTKSDRAVQITTVGMVTCDREELLLRGLASYIDNGQLHERDCRYSVMDDSRSARARERTRDQLRHLAHQKGARISYAGQEEKAQFARAIVAAADLPPEVVNMALFGSEVLTHTTGSNRNALLLDTIEEALLSVDDDTLCQVSESNGAPGKTVGTAEKDPAEFWYYADRASALDSVSFVDADILQIHERLLGRSVSELLASPAEHASRNGVGASSANKSEFHRRLESDGGRIAFTANGLVGDCGLNAPFGYWNSPMGSLLLEPDSAARMLHSEASYRMASCTREIQRAVPQPFVTDHSFSMTTFMGLDNRELLPPFIPILGEDFAYGATLWACVRDAFFGHLPWALVHAPMDRRQFWPGEVQRTASGIDMARLFIECVNSCKFDPDEPSTEARMQALGNHLIGLGELPLGQYEDFVHTELAVSTARLTALIEAVLDRPGERPSDWIVDAENYLQRLRQASQGPDYVVPLELRRHRNLDEAHGLSQKLISELGRLLYWWPKIYGVARDLKASGLRLSVQVS